MQIAKGILFLMPRFIFFNFLFLIFSSCSQNSSNKISIEQNSIVYAKEELLLLERKWLNAEFALDTAYISTLMDPAFIDISSDHIHNKQKALKTMYDNINAMLKDSIFLDSLKFEEPVINFFENAAVVALITHSYKKDKGRPIEKRMRFYDVWIKRNGNWKAISSQGVVITQ